MRNFYEYRVTSFRVVDVDSIDLNIDLGWGLQYNSICRLYGLDGPEKKNKALTVKLNEWMQQKLNTALQDDDLWVRSIKKDKFAGRFLGEIFCSDININKLVLEFGYGKPYFGGSKDGLWTEEDLQKLREDLDV